MQQAQILELAYQIKKESKSQNAIIILTTPEGEIQVGVNGFHNREELAETLQASLDTLPEHLLFHNPNEQPDNVN